MNIFLVGGAVRDQMLNYPVYDKDWVVVGADVQSMIDAGYLPIGSDFPVFLHPQTKEEYALARTEKKNGTGYKGFDFYASADVTLEQDLSRRDLTINAMAMDPHGNIYDPYGGQKDLTQKRLRHVSPAFSEDPLRVLRVARFAARYAHLGFTVATETTHLMQQISDAGELEHLTKERVWQELEKALQEQSCLVFFQVLNSCGALARLLPQLEQLCNNLSLTTPLIIQKVNDLPSAAQRFSWIVYQALKHLPLAQSIEEAERLSLELRCPNSVKTSLVDTLKFYKLIKHWDSSQAQLKLDFIQSVNLLKSPVRFTQLRAVFLALESDNRLEAKLESIEILVQELNKISPQVLIKQGFKGAELGKQLRRLQLQICSNHGKTHAADNS